MKKLFQVTSVFLILCLLLTGFAGAAVNAQSRSYSLDGGRVTLSLPASWETETDLDDGRTLLSVTRLDGGYTFTVIKQTVYHLIEPVSPPVSVYSAGAQVNAVSGSAADTKFSTHFTEDESSATRSYWSDNGDEEYRFTFTRNGAVFSDAEIAEIEKIMATVEINWFNGFIGQLRPIQQTSFRDLEGHWAKDACYRAVELGLFQGTGDRTFSPDQPMARAMLVTVLYRMAGEPAAGTAGFSDVPKGAYYEKAVAWAADNGIAEGSGNRFRPNDPVTRQELAAILYRYSGAADVPADAVNGFSDAGAVAAWARPAVNWAVSQGLLNGSGGKLLPTGTATRAQTAAILVRYMDGQ